ncbi:MAG TPA: hypothetical protein VGX27_10015 [Candidatus Dormibacteraeota bacterium]|nr:hypothetical protein [Candidatus Dormibacteraeota bacterium]
MAWPSRIRVAVVLLALVQIAIWVLAAAIEWSFRYLMVGPGSPAAINRERFAVALFFAAAINLTVLVPFLSHMLWGWLILTLVQITDTAVSVVLLVTVSTDWWLVATLAAITTALLFTWRRIQRHRQGSKQLER